MSETASGGTLFLVRRRIADTETEFDGPWGSGVLPVAPSGDISPFGTKTCVSWFEHSFFPTIHAPDRPDRVKATWESDESSMARRRR